MQTVCCRGGCHASTTPCYFPWQTMQGSCVFSHQQCLTSSVPTCQVAAAIEERIARWTLLPVGNGEGLQVLKYRGGQKYDGH
jgi:hypothetical protein